MNISIKKSTITSYGKQMCDISSDFLSNVNRLENVIEGINNAWDGADALKYINTLRENYISRLNKVADDINKYGEYLINTSGAYDLLDEIFSNKNIDV